jgi:hypothetical protein
LLYRSRSFLLSSLLSLLPLVRFLSARRRREGEIYASPQQRALLQKLEMASPEALSELRAMQAQPDNKVRKEKTRKGEKRFRLVLPFFLPLRSSAFGFFLRS